MVGHGPTRSPRYRQRPSSPDESPEPPTRPDKFKQVPTCPDKPREGPTSSGSSHNSRQVQTGPERSRQVQAGPDKSRQVQTSPKGPRTRTQVGPSQGEGQGKGRGNAIVQLHASQHVNTSNTVAILAAALDSRPMSWPEISSRRHMPMVYDELSKSWCDSNVARCPLCNMPFHCVIWTLG